MFRKAPSLYSIDHIPKILASGPRALVEGRWVASRPLGYYSLSSRLRLAWRVFVGDYDALRWPGQEA